MQLTPEQFKNWVANNEQRAEEERLKKQKEREAIIKKYIPKQKKSNMDLTSKTIESNFKDIKTNEFSDCMAPRTATIIFEINIDDYWQFKECKYSGLSETYTEEDWDFLKEVADEIKNIRKELNK